MLNLKYEDKTLFTELFEEVLDGSFFGGRPIPKKYEIEYHIVTVSENYSQIYFKVPGIKKSDIKITVENNLLNVEVPKKNWYDMGGKYPEMSNISFKIGSHVDVENIQSRLEDGILIVSFNKNMDKKDTKKTIEIK